MKTMKFVSLITVGLALAVSSCSKTAGSRYIDLSTGKEVKLEKDESTGLWVDEKTKTPVYMYVDTKTNDTIYGSTGAVINGRVIRLNDGSYAFDGDYENQNGEYKVKVEKDGDIKIKDENSKIKIDPEEGEKKVKNN